MQFQTQPLGSAKIPNWGNTKQTCQNVINLPLADVFTQLFSTSAFHYAKAGWNATCCSHLTLHCLKFLNFSLLLFCNCSHCGIEVHGCCSQGCIIICLCPFRLLAQHLIVCFQSLLPEYWTTPSFSSAPCNYKESFLLWWNIYLKANRCCACHDMAVTHDPIVSY